MFQNNQKLYHAESAFIVQSVTSLTHLVDEIIAAADRAFGFVCSQQTVCAIGQAKNIMYTHSNIISREAYTVEAIYG